jgi:glycosyltransferase involved in cell wall biosynthesis
MIPPPVTIVAHDVGGIGGMERQLEKLISGLLDAGGAVTVISRTCRLPSHERLRWVRIAGPSRPFPLAFPWFYLVASVMAARRGRGLLHSTGAIICNRVDVTTVHFCHMALRRQGWLRRGRRATAAYTLSARLSAAISRATERRSYSANRARRVVGVSRGVARELRLCYPQIADRVEAIPNGVDLEQFRPQGRRREQVRAALGLDATVRVAVFVGSEWERKGLECAIVAVARRPVWHLLIVGRGDTTRYSRLATDAGCRDRVHFVGEVADVSAYLAAGDAFLLPTRYETFSLVAFEAAASGLPLLVTRVSGVEEILEDGVNGWFVEPHADTIEPRLAQLELNEPRRALMGRKARAAVERFDWRSVVSAYCDLYARLGPPTVA